MAERIEERKKLIKKIENKKERKMD